MYILNSFLPTPSRELCFPFLSLKALVQEQYAIEGNIIPAQGQTAQMLVVEEHGNRSPEANRASPGSWHLQGEEAGGALFKDARKETGFLQDWSAVGASLRGEGRSRPLRGLDVADDWDSPLEKGRRRG
ncbi:Histone-Lysine N-Methyltransferase, H3 Lysine-36 Specific [Manis pentadactyla]|nr:Histone-Lysine N-Methyltransferase, H3 Lysine-36 Specific [Manis pentadactyla]